MKVRRKVKEGFLGRAATRATALGLTVERCGDWLWIGGNTTLKAEALRRAGFEFHRAKRLWYYRVEKSENRGSAPMDYIRQKYGSQVIHTARGARLGRRA